MRWRRREDLGRNYDSVLDTMTNVVGILIIIVALTQVGVGSAIEKVRDRQRDGADLPQEVTTEQLEASREDREKALRALEELRDRWGVLEARVVENDQELARVRELIAELEREAANATDFGTRLQDLAGEEGILTAEIAKLQRELAALRPRVERLRRRLTDAPEEDRGAATVRVPFPDRSRAEGKEPITFHCREGKLCFLDDAGLDKCWKEALASVLHGKTRLSDRDVFSVCKHFLDNEVGDEVFRLRMLTSRSLDMLSLRYERRDSAPHDRIDALGAGSSRFEKRLAGLDPKKAWLYFYVWDDSFEVYLRARKIAENMGYAVGWIGYAEDEELNYTLMGGSGGGGRVRAPD